MNTNRKTDRFQYNMSPGTLMFIARRQLAISRTELAQRMNIPLEIYSKYEHCKLRVPNTLLLKILMFGLDFWGDKMTWGIKPYRKEKSYNPERPAK